MLMDKYPQIKLRVIMNEAFIEQIMKPHTPYPSIKDLFTKELSIHETWHISLVVE